MSVLVADQSVALRGDADGDLTVDAATLMAPAAALSVPCGFDNNGRPIASLLLGPTGGDDRLLDAPAAYQSVTEWHLRVSRMVAGEVAK